MAEHQRRTTMLWRRPARRGSDEGAAMVETAIIIWTLLLIALGIVDFGMMFRHSYSLAGAVRSGARTGAIEGNDIDADWKIMQAVLNSRGTLDSGKITRIVIFEATDEHGKVPDACKTAPQSGVCNVLDSTHFGMDAAALRTSGAVSHWPATSRASSALTDTDFLGVWTLTEFDYITGIFGSRKSIADTTVMRLDPQAGNVGTSGSTLPPPPTTTSSTTTTTTSAPSSTATTKKPKKPKKTTTTTKSTATTKKPKKTTTTTKSTATTKKPKTSTTKSTATTAATTTTTRPATTTTKATTTTTKATTTTTAATTTTTVATTTTTFQRGLG